MNQILMSLDEAIGRFTTRVAIVTRTNTITYEQFGERIAQMARTLLAAGNAGARIGICLPNSADYLTIYYGALRAGHLPFLLDASFQIGELEAMRDDCGLEWLVVDNAKRRALSVPMSDVVELTGEICMARLERRGAPGFDPAPTTATCRFTSGSTGKPKCIEFSDAAVHLAAKNWAAGTGLDQNERILCLAAISNGLAFNTSILSTFMSGAQVHVAQGLPVAPAVARKIAQDEITRLVAFPTVYRVLTSDETIDGAALRSLRCAISAGAPLWQQVRDRFVGRFGRRVADYYGIAETGPVTFDASAAAHEGLGHPLPGAAIRIAETGEILVKTASMATRYLNFPGGLESKVDAEGYYHSGDLGELRDGRLFLTGRVSSFVNVGGRKIDPEEVLQAVLAVPGVQDAVAIPEQNADGETVLHLLVAGPPSLRRAQVVEACRSRIAAWKIPGRITVVEKIPRNGIGKPVLSEIGRLCQSETYRDGDSNERTIERQA